MLLDNIFYKKILTYQKNNHKIEENEYDSKERIS